MTRKILLLTLFAAFSCHAISSTHKRDQSQSQQKKKGKLRAKKVFLRTIKYGLPLVSAVILGAYLFRKRSSAPPEHIVTAINNHTYNQRGRSRNRPFKSVPLRKLLAMKNMAKKAKLTRNTYLINESLTSFRRNNYNPELIRPIKQNRSLRFK